MPCDLEGRVEKMWILCENDARARASGSSYDGVVSDDDDKRIEQQLRGTIPFEDIELLIDDADIIDASDLLEELHDGDDVEERTDPFLPSLPESTRQHKVPADLLWKAMRPDEGWVSTYAIVGRNGMIRVGADAFDKLVPGERVEVRVRRLKRLLPTDD